jgi:4-amino-4-deoxy-L-arabinose transferase-like glycosyltransferase
LRFPVAPVVFLLALAARVAVAVWLPDQVIWADGRRYETIALNIGDGDGFGPLYMNSASVPTQPIIIAAVYAVFGHSYLALRLTFAVIGALSCVVGYLIAQRLFSKGTALIAGTGLAFYPYLVYLSALFEYPQTFFILAAGLFFLFLLRFRDSQRLPDLLVAGGSLGLAILSVPTMLLYVPIALATVFCWAKSQRLLQALVLSAALSVPVGAWTVRNYVAYDRFVLVNAAGGINFWIANNATYYRYGKPGLLAMCIRGVDETQRCTEKLDVADATALSRLTPDQFIVEQERAAWKKGLSYVAQSPSRFLDLTLRRFRAYWSPVPDVSTADEGSGGSARNAIAMVSYTPVLLLAIWGVWLTHSRWRQLLPIYGYFIVFSAAYSVFLPTTRYRLPLDFFLVIFAAVAAGNMWNRMRHHGSAPVE